MPKTQEIAKKENETSDDESDISLRESDEEPWNEI